MSGLEGDLSCVAKVTHGKHYYHLRPSTIYPGSNLLISDVSATVFQDATEAKSSQIWPRPQTRPVHWQVDSGHDLACDGRGAGKECCTMDDAVPAPMAGQCRAL